MPEQIIVEIISDASQLQPTVDILEKLGQIDKDTAAAFRQSNAEIAKKVAVTKQLTAENSKAAKTFQDIEDGMAAAADIRYKAALQTLEKQVAELKATVADYTKKLDEAGKSTQDAGTQAVSARARLRQMREELVLLASQGQQNTARFRQLQNEAGELADTMADVQATISATGSDTRNLAGLISIAQGVAGGFAIAQGAATLFDNENEELNAVLQKTQGILAIIAGLQEVQNILQKESAANIFLTTVARNAETVATEAGTVAQEGLNTAMKLNPAGVVIAAILALVSAYAVYKSTVDDSIESSKAYNDELAKTSSSVGEAQIKLDVLRQRVQAAGNSYSEKQAILKQYNKEFGDTIGKATSINQLEKILIEQAPEYIKMLGLKAKAQAAQNLALKQYESAIQKQLEAEKLQGQVGKTLGAGLADALGGKGTAQKSVDNVLAEVKEVQDGIAQLNAISAAAEKQAADIATKFHFKSEDDKTNKTKKETDKRQKLAEDARKKQLETESAAEVELKKLRDENYLSQFADDAERAKEKVIQDTNNEEARIKALKINEDTRRQLLAELRQREVDELAAIDRKAADDRLKTEKAEQERLATGRIAALEKAQTETLATLDRLDAERKAKEKKKTDDEKKKREQQAEILKGLFIDLGNSFKEIYGTDATSVALQNLDNLGAKAIDVFQKIKDGAISTGEGVQLLAQDFLSAINAVGTQSFADQRQQRQADLQDELNAIAAVRDQELSNENLTAQQKADIKARYEAKEKQAKLKAFEADKQAAKTQAEIQGALAVIKSLAVYGFTPAGLLAAAAATAQTLIEVALINGKQPPRYKLGKRKGQAVPDSGWAYVDDGGKREPILRQNGTVEWASGPARERLTLLHRNDEVFPSINHFLDRFQLPSVSAEVMALPGGNSSGPIDYQRLSKEIAKEMSKHIPEPVVNSITMDENGFSKHIIKKGSRQKVLNGYHKFSK